MPVHDQLGVRMKTYYEQIPKTRLMHRTPVAIRIGENIPIFKGKDRNYIESLIQPEE